MGDNVESENVFGPEGTFLTAAYSGLPPQAIKKAQVLAKDARLAVLTGLIPILGFAFILRLIQWYLLARKYPDLVAKNLQTDQTVRAQFQSALPRFWFAASFWPAIFVAIVVLSKLK